MKVLVAYASQFGSTEEIARRIGQVLQSHGLAVDVRPADEVADLDYSAFVIGSAIHGGHWLKPAVELARRAAREAQGRPAWLFSSGPVGERFVTAPQPEPKEIPDISRRLAARDHRIFAGAFDKTTADLSKLPLIERTFVGAFLPQGDFREWPEIERWAHTIGIELRSVEHTVPARGASL